MSGVLPRVVRLKVGINCGAPENWKHKTQSACLTQHTKRCVLAPGTPPARGERTG